MTTAQLQLGEWWLKKPSKHVERDPAGFGQWEWGQVLIATESIIYFFFKKGRKKVVHLPILVRKHNITFP